MTSLILGLTLLAAQAERPPATPAPSWPAIQLNDTTGRAHSTSRMLGPRATVVVFISPECPISNGYLPVLGELSRSDSGKECTWLLIYPGDVTVERLRRHAEDYRITLPVYHDHQGAMASALAATHVPEAFVFDSRGRLAYHGRIDDRYTRRGGPPREPRVADLQDAITAVLRGEHPGRAFSEPIGCPLSASAVAAKSPSGVTFSKDVAPILEHRCVECHRQGGIGPFALTDYSSARKWAEDIVTFTQSGQMPPWKPVGMAGEFVNERNLSETEKKTLADWVAAGCPPGEKNGLSDRFVADGWKSGPPDLILEAESDYTLDAAGRDEYRCFVLKTNFSEDKYVSGFEVLPGNRKIVHHVIVFIDSTNASERLDARDAQPGYSTTAGFPGFVPSGSLGGWAPGNSGRSLPAGTARLLPKGARVVIQVHYHKTGKKETDRTRIGLYFCKEPVERIAFELMVVPPRARFGGLVIPAGAEDHECKGSLTLADDYIFYSTTPHMHLIGKDMRVTAKLPDGSQRLLINIEDWDFNWQETYRYRQPIALPKGTRLEMAAHFDNSAGNPNNPSDPPRLVRWGEQTTDEMCIAFFEVAFQRPARSKEELRLPSPAFLLRQQMNR